MPLNDQDEKIAWEFHRWQRLDRWYAGLVKNGHNSPEAVTMVEIARFS